MTIRIALALPLAAFVLAGGSAVAQQAEVKMEGGCEKLVIAGQDVTQACEKTLVNTVAGTRTTFDFGASDGQTLSFSGTGAQQEGTEATEPLQPINLVVAGRKNSDGIVRNPAPAVGSCRFSSPERGKTRIECEATSQGKVYAGVFVTAAGGTPGAGKP